MYLEIGFPDRNSEPLEIEYKGNWTLVINWWVAYKLRYSVGSIGSAFLCFHKNFGKNTCKNVTKLVSVKYSQNLLDSTKKSDIHTLETNSKQATQKAAEATGDLIGELCHEML